MKRAVFLDRDGTLIEPVHHLTDPADVKLVVGAGAAIHRLRAHGYLCVLVTNQSVVGRGMLTEERLAEVHRTMLEQLAAHAATLDRIYHCPMMPQQTDPTVIEHPDRKPGPGLVLRAARELGIDLGRSWLVGDSISDMLAGRNAGCRHTILVRSGCQQDSAADEVADYVVNDLPAAAALIVARGDG